MMIPMDGREAVEALTHARHRLEDAQREVERAAAYYGRMYAAATTVVSRKKLAEAGCPEPEGTPHLTPEAAPPPVRTRPTIPGVGEVDQLLYVDDAAQLIGRSPSALRYMVHQGTGPPSAKVGGRRVFKLSEVQAWIDAQFDRGRQEVTGVEHSLAAHEELNPFRTTPRSRSAHRYRSKPAAPD